LRWAFEWEGQWRLQAALDAGGAEEERQGSRL